MKKGKKVLKINSSDNINEILNKYNKKSIKKKFFSIRINEYYLTALKLLSNPEEGISIQKIIRGFIEKGVDKLLKSRSK